MNKSDGLVADSEGSYMLKLLDLVYGGGHKQQLNACNATKQTQEQQNAATLWNA